MGSATRTTWTEISLIVSAFFNLGLQIKIVNSAGRFSVEGDTVFYPKIREDFLAQGNWKAGLCISLETRFGPVSGLLVL